MEHEYDQAVGSFKQAVLLSPDDTKLQEELALAQAAAGSYGEAADTLNLLLTKSGMGERIDLWRTLGAANARDGRLREAKDAYATVVRLDPTSIDDWIQLGELEFRQKNNGPALQAASRVIRLAPDRAEGYLIAGWCGSGGSTWTTRCGCSTGHHSSAAGRPSH